MADKITIQQPISLDLFASLIKVISEHSKKHQKDVQFNPQGKEIVILIDSEPKTKAVESSSVFAHDDDD